MDSLSGFPRNAVLADTEACLTSVFEMGTGDPSPYDRPRISSISRFKKVTISNQSLTSIKIKSIKNIIRKNKKI